MKKSILLGFILLLISTMLVMKFWIGIYEDDEFSEKTVFIKHRPIWQSYFYSPRGMSDMRLEDMKPHQRENQLLFDEFVIEHQFKN